MSGKVISLAERRERRKQYDPTAEFIVAIDGLCEAMRLLREGPFDRATAEAARVEIYQAGMRLVEREERWMKWN